MEQQLDGTQSPPLLEEEIPREAKLEMKLAILEIKEKSL